MAVSQQASEQSDSLHANEALNRSIIESILDGYYETDLHGRFTFVNEAFAQMLGETREALLHQSYAAFTDTDEAKRVFLAFNTVYQTGLPARAVEGHLSRDGVLRYVELSITLIHDAVGEICGFRGIMHDITDRKHMEEALKTSEERYRSVINSMTDGVMVFDATGRLITYNTMAKRILRMPDLSQFILNRSFPWRTLREDGSPFPFEEFPATIALLTGEQQQEVVMGIANDEQVFSWISINAQPITDPGDLYPHAVVISFSDITVSVLAAEALRKSEQRNKALLNANPDLMFVLNSDGTCMEIKNDDRNSLGIQPVDLIGVNILDFPMGEMINRLFVYYLQRALESSQRQTFEYEDSYNRFYEVRLVALNPDEIFCIVRDITDRKQVEIEFTKRFTLLAALQQVDDELLQKLNMEYVLAVALDASLRLSGADYGFIAVVDNGQLISPNGVGPYAGKSADFLQTGPVSRVLATRKPVLIADSATEPDYQPLVPTTRAQIVMPLISSDLLVGVLNLETALPSRFDSEVFAFLELVTARIAVALDNARLYEVAHIQLEELRAVYTHVSELEQLKTQMIRVAAHDLRSPLGIITGYLSMLEEEIPFDQRDKYQQYIEPIHRAIARMQRMTRDILSLERIHAAHNNDLKPVSLNDAVKRAYLDFRDQTQNRTYTIETASSDVLVQGDSVQIYEAIANLISNAIKYTSENGRVHVSLEVVEHRAVFKVADNGIGIPADHHDKLFQPFYRVKTNETRRIDGTGLGLYLVKSIIERHQGVITFQSVHGQGSTFTLELPLAE